MQVLGKDLFTIEQVLRNSLDCVPDGVPEENVGLFAGRVLLYLQAIYPERSDRHDNAVSALH